MRRHLQRITFGLVVVALAGMGVGAQQPDAVIEPESMEALTRMGTYLRTLEAFQVTATTSREDVLEDGQKITFAGVTDLLAEMPNRLLISLKSDQHDRRWYYDGTSFTLLAERVNYYATIEAPDTIGKLADLLDERYDLNMPLEDLFRWGGPQSKEETITSAMFIGPSVVDGVTCGHYAFRQEGLDWQVWIQFGDFPLPRKLVLTTTTDEARPQYVATFDWNLAPSYNDESFTFIPPEGAGKIVLAEVQEEK